MEWKDVVGYEGYYMVSSCGEVKSVDREIKHGGSGKKAIRKGSMKNKTENSDGYYAVNLCKYGKTKSFRLHRLVALSFLKNDEVNKNEVNHIDGNRKNNHFSNLEWVTHGENVRHSYKLGNKCSKGEKNGMSKLKKEDINTIKDLSKKGMTGVEISKIYGVSSSSIYRILKNKGWV